MPVITSHDLRELAELEEDIADSLKNNGKVMSKIAKLEDRLANGYKSYRKDLREHRELTRKRLQKMEDLKRSKVGVVTDEELSQYAAEVQDIEDTMKKIDILYDALKELSGAKDHIYETIKDYTDELKEAAGLRKDIVSIDEKIEKERESNYAADRMNKMEIKKQEIEREYQRAKKNVLKKKDYLEDEREDLRHLWDKLRESIEPIL